MDIGIGTTERPCLYNVSIFLLKLMSPVSQVVSQVVSNIVFCVLFISFSYSGTYKHSFLFFTLRHNCKGEFLLQWVDFVRLLLFLSLTQYLQNDDVTE